MAFVLMLILLVALLFLGMLVLFAICVPKSRGPVFATFILLVGGGFIVGLVGTQLLKPSEVVYSFDPVKEELVQQVPVEKGIPASDAWESAVDVGIADLSEADHGTLNIEIDGTEEVAGIESVNNELATDDAAEVAEQDFQPVEEIKVDASDQAADDQAASEDASKLVLKRPDWVSSPPAEIDGHPAVVVQSAQWETARECKSELLALVHAEAMQFATDVVYSNQVDGPAEFPLSPNDLRQITRDEYEEEVETSVGPMKRVHQLIVFDDGFKGSLRDRYYQATVEERLAQAGFMSGGLVLLLATVFGVLKVSTRSSRKETR